MTVPQDSHQTTGSARRRSRSSAADTGDDFDRAALIKGATSAEEEERPHTKKSRIISLYESGVTDIAQIVRQTGTRPSYVAQVLQTTGLISGYRDLFTSTSDPSQEVNMHSRFFRHVLQYKTVEAARESVLQIDRLYKYFERLGDRAGQHECMVVALTGQNRARWSGKQEAANVFRSWLSSA